MNEPPADLPENWEELDELADEWDEDENGNNALVREGTHLSPQQLTELRLEMAELREFHQLAKSIIKNSKGEVLLTALRNGFAKATQVQKDKGAATLQQKAVIFTESRRTQEYLFRVLEQTEFAGKVMIFNGTNTDAKARKIYQNWMKQHAGTDHISGSPSADMRAALIEYFRDEADILIATEAAAEGINLQFCNLVVNYDLPWNPQRIEQRIGRCHRYGQKYDVVVVNFLNKNNAADLRVYELLDQKFRLFSGVFGASDDVLGAVESGVDFEKRIAAIYQQCRTLEQIQFEFDQLQHDLETEITAGQQDAREKLLNNFDQEVVEKVRVQSHASLDRFNQQLWLITRFLLADCAHFDETGNSFMLHHNPFPGENIHPGPYKMGKNVEDANTYRVGHPLAQRLLEQARQLATPPRQITFDYSGSGKHIAILDRLAGQNGWLRCTLISVSALETEDHLVLTGMTDSGEELDDTQCRRFFDLPASGGTEVSIQKEIILQLDNLLANRQKIILDEMTARNGHWFDTEMDKLDHWAEDRRTSLKVELDELDEAIREMRKAARIAPNLPEKLERQRELKKLESKRDEAWRTYDISSREIEKQKDTLLDDISLRLEQRTENQLLFTIKWSMK